MIYIPLFIKVPSIDIPDVPLTFVQSTPGQKYFPSSIEMPQVMWLCLFVLVISVFVVALIWCGLCYLYAVHWMARRCESWNVQPTPPIFSDTASTHV